MEKQVVNFTKARDFGDILSDTFKFLRFEFRPLFKALLFYVGPFILISSLISGYYQMGELKEAFKFSTTDPFVAYRRMFSVEYLLVLLSAVASHSLLISALFSYIKLYNEFGSGKFELERVKSGMTKSFLPAFGGLSLIFILTIIGAIFIIIPAIIVLTLFALVMPAIVFENKGIGWSFQRSLYLVRDHFWFTLGVGVIVIIIAYLGIIVVSLPTGFLALAYGLLTLSGDSPSETYSVIITILSVITSFLTMFIVIIPNTSMAFHYFSQIEKKESPSLINKIDQINQPDDNDNSNLGF
jgi:hypothetical protein